MTTTLDIASLAAAVLYPLAIVVIFLIFRKEIPSIAKGIAGQLTKIGFSGFSLELAKAESFDPNWNKDGTLDLRHRAASINENDSTAPNLLSKLGALNRRKLLKFRLMNAWLRHIYSLP